MLIEHLSRMQPVHKTNKFRVQALFDNLLSCVKKVPQLNSSKLTLARLPQRENASGGATNDCAAAGTDSTRGQNHPP